MNKRNTRLDGGAFDYETILLVWRKAEAILGLDPNHRRSDKFGNQIDFFAYGNTDSNLGWEIDHIKPVAKGGTDDLSNLQPLQWEENRKKGDTFPYRKTILGGVF